MKKAYQKQIHRRMSGKKEIEPADAVQLRFEQTEVLQQMQKGLHRLGVSLGLELAAALLMKDEVNRQRTRGHHYESSSARRVYDPAPRAIEMLRDKGRLEIEGFGLRLRTIVAIP